MMITDADASGRANPRGLQVAGLNGRLHRPVARRGLARLRQCEWSDGAWGYFALPLSGAPGRGDMILFDPPDAVGSAIPYLKRVRGLPGEQVEVDGNSRVRVNGEFMGIAKSHALDGRALQAIESGVIPQGHYYVHADHADSHDSRYEEIGLVPRESIRGRAIALPDVPLLGLKGPLARPKEVRP